MKQSYVLYEDKLKGEYKQVFAQVEMYSTSHLIGVDMNSELMMELLDSLLEAQKAGTPAAKIVGDDVEAFCDNFFSEYKTHDRFLDLLKVVYNMAWIVFLFGILDVFLYWGEEESSAWRNTEMGAVIAGLYIAVYMIVRMVHNYKKYGSWKAPKQESISFTTAIKENVRNGMPEEWLKQLRKKNERRKKRGKEPLREEEYLEKLDKQYDYKRIRITNVLIFGCCTLGGVIFTAVMGGFESTVDAVIFVVLICVMEGLMYLLFHNIGKTGSDIYQKMRQRMQAENLTLEQYVEKYKDGDAP